MKKIFSLIKASMTEDMNIFKISTKKKSNFTKIVLPIFLGLILMGAMYSYAEMLIEPLEQVNMEIAVLTLFILFTSILTVIEGIYKSGNLLFNCKDDNLLLSLPIKKSTVLFIRVFKFYVFELIYNSLFLLPAIVAYAIHVKPDTMYYITSFIGLLVFPIIPILISCFLGTIITFISSKYRGKNFVQTILTFILLIGIFYFSYNTENLIKNIAQNASGINDFITKIYYPAGVYMELVTKFSIIKLLEFIIIHIILFAITIILIGKIYFNINSKTKAVKTNKTNKKYAIKSSRPIKALIKKEFGRFINSTVFITNAGLGLVLFIICTIVITVKFDGLVESLTQNISTMSIEYIKNYMPIVLFGLICFTSFMTSITSSMISLEGKSFNILKSLPVKPYTVVKAKVLAAVLTMIPCILIGDMIIFIKFKFDLLSIILITIASVVLPFLAEIIGIIVNLKYPRMDAKTDTEVVKQSMSSAICTFLGIGLTGLTIFLLFKAIEANISNNLIILIFTCIYAVICLGLKIFLKKTCDKSFENIVV